MGSDDSEIGPPGTPLDRSQLTAVSDRTLRKIADPRGKYPAYAAIAANQLGSRHEAAHRFKDAAQWYRKAAELGLIEGAYNLGTLLASWQGPEAAVPWLRKSAERGHVLSMCNLGNALFRLGDRVECETWWRRGAESGDADCQQNLGVLFRDLGRQDEADSWLRRADRTRGLIDPEDDA